MLGDNFTQGFPAILFKALLDGQKKHPVMYCKDFKEFWLEAQCPNCQLCLRGVVCSKYQTSSVLSPRMFRQGNAFGGRRVRLGSRCKPRASNPYSCRVQFVRSAAGTRICWRGLRSRSKLGSNRVSFKVNIQWGSSRQRPSHDFASMYCKDFNQCRLHSRLGKENHDSIRMNRCQIHLCPTKSWNTIQMVLPATLSMDIDCVWTSNARHQHCFSSS